MKEATFDPARRLDLYFRCNRAGSKDFVLSYSDETPYSFIYEEFEFNIYRYEGEKKIFLQLLSFSNQDTFTAQITKAQANIDEAEYYYEIYNTQTEETWLCGNAIFHNGKFDGVSNDTEDITIQINGEDINITVQVTAPSATQADLSLKQNLLNEATALVDAATIDLTAIKHTLASSSATRTFTISYTGDDITLEVTLSNTAANYTFPATSLCVSEGIASGDNILALTGVSGDKYAIAIKKIGSAYYVVAKNFGQ